MWAGGCEGSGVAQESSVVGERERFSDWQTTVQTGRQLAFVNIVLLEHSHVHSFTYGVWLLLCYKCSLE